tara:strand:- start:7282 stop:7599 length:318 start_codon:yes stop_codon:yes gene_type:complete
MKLKAIERYNFDRFNKLGGLKPTYYEHLLEQGYKGAWFYGDYGSSGKYTKYKPSLLKQAWDFLTFSQTGRYINPGAPEWISIEFLIEKRNKQQIITEDYKMSREI